jgi:hypothetical protein
VREQRNITAGVPIIRRDKLNRTVLMLMVVPRDERGDPGPCRVECREGLRRKGGAVLERAKQRFRVIVTLTRGRLKDGITPSRSKVASIVAPFIGPPLSACSTRPAVEIACS